MVEAQPGEGAAKAAAPQASFPLAWNAEQNYGFLHRLDIPSSGLVLCGTTFEGRGLSHPGCRRALSFVMKTPVACTKTFSIIV